MRSLLDVKTEIISNIEDCSSGTLTKVQLSRKKNRIEFLRIVESYLQSAPDELYLGREIKRIENKINALMSTFDRTQYKDPREAIKKHENAMGIPQLRMQLRTLWYIKK